MRSAQDFWKEIVITQIISGSISFAASTLIVTCIARDGLITPYRRIIFGLSVSDMFQSFAILAGPWLAPSDVSQALWGIGNMYTCHLDGFLYYLGLTTVPMYIVFLCVYYVCKLKNRMSDAQFTQRIEKKVHCIIVVISLGLCLAAIGTDAIHPTFLGNRCSITFVPTGCYHKPEVFGECDKGNAVIVRFFIIISYIMLPFFYIIAIFVCMGLIFLHVLVRERIFAPSNTANVVTVATATGENASTAAAAADGVISAPENSIMGRDRYLLSSSISEESSVDQINNASDEEDQTNSLQSLPKNAMTTLMGDNDVPDDTCTLCIKHTREDEIDNAMDDPQDNDKLSLPDTTMIENNTCIIPSRAALIPQEDAIQSASNVSISSGLSNCAGASVNIFPSDQSMNISYFGNTLITPQSHNQPGQRINRNINDVRSSGADTASLSRLYKKELITQVFCYVMVFALTMLPAYVMAIYSRKRLPLENAVRVSCFLHPLAGFFNILVYTRWNVRSLRRRDPECSWLRAFWLVLKAGGDLPRAQEE